MVESCVNLSCQGSFISALAFQVFGTKPFMWVWHSSISGKQQPYAVMNYGIVSGFFPKANMALEGNSNFYQRPAL